MSKLGTTRPTTVVNVVTNLDLLAEHEAAVAELERLNRTQSASDRLNSAYSKEIREQAKKIQSLENQMDESTVCVKLRALKRAQYAEVTANHPAREDNDVDTTFGVNTDTFGDELIPLSIVDAWNKSTGEKVDFTGDDWAAEAEEFTDAQYSEFIMAALNINRGATAIPFFVDRLRREPELRREVEAAERLGVSVKRFNGWEPTITYVYDDDGRLRSSQAEPEWDETQRNWMLSLAEYRAGICPICGYPKEICQSPDNASRFVANPPSRCHATTALKRFQKDNEYEYPEALVWSAALNPDSPNT